MAMVWVHYKEIMPLVLPPNPTILDIKREIESAYNIPVQNQMLYYSNVLLQDHMYASYYYIQPDADLFLFVMGTFTISYNSSTYTVYISDEKSVGDLAELAGQQIGVSTADFVLVWEEQELDETMTIRDYGIPINGAIIRMILKMGIFIEGKKCEYFVRVGEKTTVGKVKQKLEDSFGLNKMKIQLIAPANPSGYLADNHTMFDCGIDGDTRDRLLLVED